MEISRSRISRARRSCGIWARSKAGAALVTLFCLGGVPGVTAAFEADETLAKGTKIFSLQVGGGVENSIGNENINSQISFVSFEPRFSYLPFELFGSGWLRSALELGLEGWYQQFLHPDSAYALGLKLALRYHLIGFGRVVPYLEGTAGAAGTTLDVRESRTAFTFVLEGGAGVSYLITEEVAVNLGYRFQHVSNGNTQHPNKGFSSNTGVLGVSFLFH